MADRLGVLIGLQVAKDCGWRPGMGVSPKNAFTGIPLELHIIGIRAPQQDPMEDTIAIGHYEYVNANVMDPSMRDKVWTIVAAAHSPRAAPALAAKIEAAFASDNPPVEVSTTTEVQNGLARYGQAQQVLGWVMLAVFLCAALVMVSVLAHTAAQRRAHMALLQALGFSRHVLWGGFMLAAVATVLVGAGIGTTTGLLVLRFLPRSLARWFGNFAVPTWTWWGLPVLLILLLAAALVIPTLAIVRLRPTDARAL
jgi:ABC-type lipoprotein release transport system permease subunit